MRSKLCTKCKVEKDVTGFTVCKGNTEEEVLKLNHYSNLQPLSKEDHLIKTKNDIGITFVNKK